jgi:hypothetical protein
MNKSLQQRLAVHAAEQPARKPNARRHGSKPNDGGNNKYRIQAFLKSIANFHNLLTKKKHHGIKIEVQLKIKICLAEKSDLSH